MKSDFNRVLGKRDIFTLSFGAMIGWGWVVLTNDWILTAGTYSNVVRILVPFTVSDDILERGLDIIEKGLKKL